MTVYLDTSVILRVLLQEPGRIDDWGQWTAAYSSRLWYTEALRVLDRLRLTGQIDDSQVVDLRREVDKIDQTLFIVPVTEAILSRASDAFPTVVGTLDAIHLASAIQVRHATMIDRLITHDSQLGTAAAAVGFDVHGV